MYLILLLVDYLYEKLMSNSILKNLYDVIIRMILELHFLAHGFFVLITYIYRIVLMTFWAIM